jgi:hypothetical protein
MSRTIIIGDIHGCLGEFQELIRALVLSSEDRVVCLGDFMDKGPDPVGCVRFARNSGFSSVAANHEEKHLRWRRHEDRRVANPHYKNPMKPMSAEKLAQNADLSAEDVAWLRALPVMIQFENWLVVHGGLLPGVPLEKQKADTLLRVRWVDGAGKHIALDPEDPRQPEGSKLWSEVWDGRENVVYGHAAHSLSTPRVDRNGLGAECWGIDTGAAYGGRLTALVLETREVIQVQAAKVYQEPPWPIPE